MRVTIATNPCKARWLESCEVYCQLEAGHLGEHFSKAVMEFAQGHDGRCQIWWRGQNAASEGRHETGTDH